MGPGHEKLKLPIGKLLRSAIVSIMDMDMDPDPGSDLEMPGGEGAL